MPDTPITAGTNYVCSMLYGGGTPGWSENYYINVQGGSTPQIAAANSMARLILLRRNNLPINVDLIGLRVSEDDTRGRVLLAAAPDYNLGGGMLPDPAGPANYGWNTSLETEFFTVDNRIVVRGWTAADQDYVIGDGTHRKPPVRVVNWGVQMKTFTQNSYSSGGSVCVFVIKSFVRPTLGADNVPFSSVVSLGTDRLSFDIPSSAASRFDLNQEVQINVVRKKCLRGLSGRGIVVGKGGTPPTATLIVAKRLCCGADALSGVVGTVFPITKAYYQVGRWSNLGLGVRKTGRAFFQQLGRRSGACC